MLGTMSSHLQVDVEEFFQLFFSDEGVAFLKDFHAACGDEGMGALSNPVPLVTLLLQAA